MEYARIPWTVSTHLLIMHLASFNLSYSYQKIQLFYILLEYTDWCFVHSSLEQRIHCKGIAGSVKEVNSFGTHFGNASV